MDNQTPAKQNGEQPDDGSSITDAIKPGDSKATHPATAQQLTRVERQTSGFEKSTLRWARTAVILSGLAAAFVCAQWWEMHKAGSDTRNLAIAAKISADAAKRAAKIADQTLHISERAYLIMGSPIDDFQHGRVDVPIFNNGHIPSGPVQVIVHEITFKISDPSEHFYRFTHETVIEKHWRIHKYQVIPIGNIFNIEVHVPSVVPGDLAGGKQGVAIAAVMTYNDGFPGTTEQKWIFCDGSTYSAATKLFAMRPCEDSTSFLEALTKEDGYPDPRYQETN